MSDNNGIELKVLKVTRYKGKLISLHYKIRSDSVSSVNYDIPYTWAKGSIRLDMTKIFSATFQKTYRLRYDEETHAYIFMTYKKEKCCVIEDIVRLVEKVNTDYYLLGGKL